ncbi:MAG: hypothetical protein PVH99_12010 [Desulfobacteraceae bacterium]|jgi:hypothetical protein
MRIDCNLCGYELNLDHKVFQNYEGPVKCFSCGNVMHIKASRGIIDSSELSNVLQPHSHERLGRRTPQNPGL